MNNIKLGWKRNAVKTLQLIAAFLFGLFSWGIIAEVFNAEPQKIAFAPLIIIAILWTMLSLYHRRVDYKLTIKILEKQTGLDVSKIANEINTENLEKKAKENNVKEKKDGNDDKK